MYLIFLISCACIIFVQAHPVNKRDIFDSFPFGGNLGCVVTVSYHRLITQGWGGGIKISEKFKKKIFLRFLV